MKFKRVEEFGSIRKRKKEKNVQEKENMKKMNDRRSAEGAEPVV